MKKAILMIIIISTTLVLFLSNYNINVSNDAYVNEEYEWNGGYCIDDGGKLNYTKTGSKNHYVCENCGKEYRFNKIMKYK